jgi:D-galactarolactone cycloisomerase
MANAHGVRHLTHMWEFDRTEHPIRQAILSEPIEHERGIVRVPHGPGLGVEIDCARSRISG